MKNFIVRIYRCEENRPDHFVGLVENVSSSQKQAFSSYDELWSILKPDEPNGDREKTSAEPP